MHTALTFVVVLCLSSGAIGQTAPPPANTAVTDDPSGKKNQDSAEKARLEESIVVTATRGEREVSELPISSTVLSQKKIERAPAITIDDMLRTVAGLHVPLLGSTSQPATASRFSMHGLGGTRALVLVDGVPAHDPFYGTVEWQKVPVDTLRQVEIVRGGSAGLFGNYALGGTVNLRTRPVEESSVRASVAFGNLATNQQSIAVDQVLNSTLGMRVSFDRFDTGGFPVIVNPGPLDIAAPANNSVFGLRADYRPSDTTSSFFKVGKARIETSNGLEHAGQRRDVLDFAGGVQLATSNSGLLTGTLFTQQMDLHDTDAGVATGGLSTYQSTNTTIPGSTTGGSLEWSLQRTGALPVVTFGADATFTKSDETTQSLDQTGFVTSTKLVQGKQAFAGAFAQASWRPNARLEVLGALRTDYYRNEDGGETLSGTFVAYPEETETQIDPRISMRYSLNGNAVLRGSAYRAFKAPTLRDLYRSASGNRGNLTLANPGLRPERLVGAEVGVEWAFSRANVALNLYRSDVEDLAVRVLVAPNTSQPQNVGKIRSQGVELMVNAAITRHWSFDAAYTYADSTVIEDPNPALIGKLVPDVVPHIGSLAVRYQSERGTTVDLRGRTLSTSYGEAQNATPQPAHQVFDVSVFQRLRPWVDAYVIAENVFDEFYYYVAGSTKRAVRPRTVTGGFRFRFATGRER